MEITGIYQNSNKVEISFKLIRRENGDLGMNCERIDKRREKKYGVRISVGGKVECGDYQLATEIGRLTRRAAVEILQEEEAKGGSRGALNEGSQWSESVYLAKFIAAGKPSAILNGWEPEIKETADRMAAALEKGFEVAIKEWEAECTKKAQARSATHLARWACNEAVKKVEESIQYKEKLEALNKEREGLIRVFLKDTSWIREAAEKEPEHFPPHVIEAALRNLGKFEEETLDDHGPFRMESVEIKPEDLEGGEK